MFGGRTKEGRVDELYILHLDKKQWEGPIDTGPGMGFSSNILNHSFKFEKFSWICYVETFSRNLCIRYITFGSVVTGK